MAKFKRRENGLKIEFGNKIFNIDVADSELGKKLIDFGERASNKDEVEKLPIEEQKQEIIDFYESILGKGAYEEIKKEAFEGEELKFEDLLDVGYFLIEEINKYNESTIKERNKRENLAKVVK